MDADEKCRPDEQVVLAEHGLVLHPIGLEYDGEVVVGVFVDLRALVLVLDVLDRQRVKLEGLLQQLVVAGIWILDVQPEAIFVGVDETTADRSVVGVIDLRIRRWRPSVPGAGHGLPRALPGRPRPESRFLTPRQPRARREPGGILGGGLGRSADVLTPPWRPLRDARDPRS